MTRTAARRRLGRASFNCSRPAVASLCALLAAGCETPAKDCPPPTAQTSFAAAASVSASAASASAASADTTRQARQELLRRLGASAVSNRASSHRELFTWTTREQADGLRKNKRLLTRTSSPTKGEALFDQRLAAGKTPIDRALLGPALRYRRFAWTNPWATAVGWEGESYGSELVQVTLRPDAIIGTLDSGATERWSFSTLDGKAVELAVAVENIARLAAVFHVWRGKELEAEGSEMGGERPFRELVLCNESMIERWSLATPELHERLLADRSTMLLMAAHLKSLGSQAAPSQDAWAARLSTKLWPGKADDQDPIELFGASLAFANERYTPAVDQLELIASTLHVAAFPSGSALSHAPKLAFGAVPQPTQWPARPQRPRFHTF